MKLGTIRYHLSAYGSLQDAFQKNIRMWFLQKKQNTNWHIWDPPGIVFAKTKLSKKEVFVPPLSEWYFPASFSPHSFEEKRYKICNMDITAYDPKWIVKKCILNPDELYVVVTHDFAQLFHILCTYIRAFNMDPYELHTFPNLRIICTHYKYVDKFFPIPLVKNVYVHLDAIKSFASFSLSKNTDCRPSNLLSSSSYDQYDIFFTENMIKRISSLMEDMGEVHIYSNLEENIKFATKSLISSTATQFYESAFPFPHYLNCTEKFEKESDQQKNKSAVGNTILNEYLNESETLKCNEKITFQQKFVQEENIKQSNDSINEKKKANDVNSMWIKKTVESSTRIVSEKTAYEDTDINIFLKNKNDCPRKESTSGIISYKSESDREKVQEKSGPLFYANFIRIPPQQPNFRLKNPICTL